MSLQIKTLINIIAKTAKFDFCYLFEMKEDNYSVISSVNRKITSSDGFAKLNKVVFNELFGNVALIDNHESFSNFLIKNKFTQYYIDTVYEQNGKKSILFGFSKKKYKNNKSLSEIRTSFKKLLYEKIVNDEQLSQSNENDKASVDLSCLSKVAEHLGYVFYEIKDEKIDLSFSKEAAIDLFDISGGDLIQSGDFLISKIKSEYLQDYNNFLDKLKNNQVSSIDYQIRSELGIEKYIRQIGIPVFVNGNYNGFYGIIQNKTKEKKNDFKLEKSEEIVKTITELSESMIFLLDNNGYFNFINNYGAVTLGFNKEEIIGKHFFEFIQDDSKADASLAFQQVLDFGSKIVFKSKIEDRFKNVIGFNFTAKSLKQNNDVVGMVGIGVDTTEKLRGEIKIKDLTARLFELSRLVSIEKDRAKHQISVLEELNRLKNEFISNVSHELRTPLASIVGFAETIVSDREMATETIYEFSSIILEEGKRLARLINDILDFSKLEGGNELIVKQRFDLVSVLLELFDSYTKIAESKGIKLNKQIPDAEIILNSDKERITKALVNLLSNAVKFTKSGGYITIITQDFLKEVEIIISDTGIGIAKEDIPKLFQKFTKISRVGVQQPGAGFGLPVVKQIIDLHKGLIRVESEPNKGTTFIIRLPKE